MRYADPKVQFIDDEHVMLANLFAGEFCVELHIYRVNHDWEKLEFNVKYVDVTTETNQTGLILDYFYDREFGAVFILYQMGVGI